ncbi:MAG: hypothetical protein QXW35_02380 [Candidatus Aenigmatarchaeota archaeon]
MNKSILLVLLGFVIGSIWGSQILEYIYVKTAEIRASILGQSSIIVDADYITIKKLPDSIYVYLDIDKPIKTILYIPINESNISLYYNISNYIESIVTGTEDDLSIVINHKKPIVP